MNYTAYLDFYIQVFLIDAFIAGEHNGDIHVVEFWFCFVNYDSNQKEMQQPSRCSQDSNLTNTKCSLSSFQAGRN